MRRIAFLVSPQTVCSSLSQALDCFSLANRLAGEPLFELQLCSQDGQPVSLGYARIEVNGDLSSAEDADLILLPATGPDTERTLATNPALIAWLTERPASQPLASLCSSAFLLAAAGQLDGLSATTHWRLCEQFALRYPQVRLEANALFTQQANRATSGGAQAGLDLCVELIAQLAGEPLAQQLAGALVIERRRGPQSRYRPLVPEPCGDDPALLGLLRHMGDTPAAPHDLASLAQRLHCSSRTLLRRFRAETGLTPNDYLQRLRIQAAQQALAERRRSLDSIALAVGYQDRASFTRLFKRLCGESPARFRERLASGD